ncbi:MAG: ABC transporter substrate-binding protein [Acidobacteriia bacterium]|nr:ABC transporter substrate-binding protein [Terriglobia bacterium]
MRKPADVEREELRNGPTDPPRRQFLRNATAAAALAAAAPRLVFGKSSSAGGRAIKIGFVSPRTGALAPFGEGDAFVLSEIRKFVKAGVAVNGVNHPVQIIDKDSQSDATRAAEIALGLIKSDRVDLILAASTGDTVTPVSEQCEKSGVPCITTDCPWQVYFHSRGGTVDNGFDWTYHFFWGLEDVIAVFTNMWGSIPTNKVVGGLWTDDRDGHAHSDPNFGFPHALPAKGFKLVDPGRFLPSTTDFSTQISAFKNANVEILTGVLPTPVFANFWSQAAQQGFRPKIATIAKALLFPAAVETLGNAGAGLTTEVWWSPSHPFKSELTGQNSAELCGAYEDATKRQWTQPLGFRYALFEVALNVLNRCKNIDAPLAIRDAICTTDYNSVVGHIAWKGDPVKNVAKTSLVGGQWVPGWRLKGWAEGQKFKYDLMIVNNDTDPSIGTQQKLIPLPEIKAEKSAVEKAVRELLVV